MGTPLMPWQRMAADVALEIDPRTGRLAYREVIITVPRQSGKTSLLLPVAVHRGQAFDAPQRTVYTAQTRGRARQKWADDQVPAIQKSIFGRRVQSIRYANDSETLYWSNGSTYGVEGSSETAGHGKTLDLAFIDEAFAEQDSRKEQALRPTMLTRPEPQLWIVSTAGNERSTFLRSKVDAARIRCANNEPSSIAYFEWSADPVADPADPDTWWSCMPALGHTVTEDAMRAAQHAMPAAEFARAYLNVWPDGLAASWAVIGKDEWTRAADHESRIPDPAPRVFAVDTSPERAWSSIAVAAIREDGREHVEVVDHHRGTDWVVARLADLVARWNAPGPVVLAGPAAHAFLDDLRAEGVDALAMSLTDSKDAAGQLFDKVPGAVRHVDQLSLNTAIAGATRRTVGDAWAWSRRGDTDISPLVAVSAARWALARIPEDDTDYEIGESLPDV